MKKNTKEMFRGFTVAELLITMLITMVIAAAMVPVIGTKKVRNPLQKFYHGMYQCYYDQDGKLQDYITQAEDAITAKNANGTCSITLPEKVSSVEIILIGPGGSGYSGDGLIDKPRYFAYTGPGSSGNTVEEGFIRLYNNSNIDIMNYDINRTSSHKADIIRGIQNIINKYIAANSGNADPFTYDITLPSPVGTGGSAACVLNRNYGKSDVECASCLENYNPKDCESIKKECFTLKSASGGNSAKWYKAKFPIQLDPTSSIISSTYGGSHYLKTGDFSIYLRSKNGGNANCNISGCSDGDSNEDYINNGTVKNFVDTTEKDKYTYEIMDTYNRGATIVNDDDVTWPNKEGNFLNCKIKVSPTNNVSTGDIEHSLRESSYNDGGFAWRYTSFVVNGKYVPAGKAGQEVSQTFEKLHKTLILSPSKSHQYATGNLNSRVYYMQPNGEDPEEERTLMQTDPVNSSDLKPSSTVIQEERIPVTQLPIVTDITKLAIPNNESFSYLTKIRASLGASGGISAMCSGEGYCPGFAGYGVYPILQKLVGRRGFDMWLKPDKTKDASGHYVGAENFDDYIHYMDSAEDTLAVEDAQFNCQNNDIFNMSDKFNISDSLGEVNQAYCSPKEEIREKYKNGTAGAVIILW